MPWNPDVYNSFKDIRNKPFYDLLSFIKPIDNMKVIDIGCGTGEQSAIMAQTFFSSTVLGVDSSEEMLEKSNQYRATNLSFQKATIEEVAIRESKWDLLFSNAALQWSDDHHKLFPRLLGHLNPNGQFAVQMPVQTENILNKILLTLAKEKPFAVYLQGWHRDSPLLGIDDYTQMLFDAGLVNLRIEQRVYPIVANDHETLFNFISGSALIPYLERLNGREAVLFVEEFKKRIEEAFPKLPTIYAFKRLLLYGQLPA